MVRRAATEALCNMPWHESVLKLLRVPDKLRLWLGLGEDWHPDEGDDEKEKFFTSRASAGTLAVAAGDEGVATALCAEDCARTLRHWLGTKNVELVHRSLVIINQLLEHETSTTPARHLAEGSVIESMGVVAELNDPQLIELAKEAAEKLTKLISHF